MTASHFVRDIEFDVSFARETDATERHNALGSFVADRLVSLADEVFTAFSPSDGRVIKIDTLDLDLGVIPASRYFLEAEERFREKLEEALRARIAALATDAPRQSPLLAADERIVSSSRNEFEIVGGFLQWGYLPWNIQVPTRKQISDLLRRVIANQGQRLAALLRSVGNREAVARRICSQFPPTCETP